MSESDASNRSQTQVMQCLNEECSRFHIPTTTGTHCPECGSTLRLVPARVRQVRHF